MVASQITKTGRTFEHDQALKAQIKPHLPPGAFQPKPRRALLMIPLVGLIVAGSVALVAAPLPWYVALLVSLVIGNLYGSLMFLGHEISHGATVRPGVLRETLLYIAFAVFCLPPRLWRVWHNQVHHPNANVEGFDPDNFGTLEEFRRESSWNQFLVKYAPGSRHLLSVLFLFTCFTVQVQGVLWMKSHRRPGFERLQRKRIALEVLAMAGGWLALSIYLGLTGALLVVILPMIVANCVVMSYIATNHMLSPMSRERDTLGTTMSVTTHKVVDLVHLNFSHHVEHHLFPTMCSSYYPLVRQSLRRCAGDRYMAPAHWRALVTLFRTPRIYADHDTLVEPYSGREIEMGKVKSWLRCP